MKHTPSYSSSARNLIIYKPVQTSFCVIVGFSTSLQIALAIMSLLRISATRV